jgi:hypothetical protein
MACSKKGCVCMYVCVCVRVCVCWMRMDLVVLVCAPFLFGLVEPVGKDELRIFTMWDNAAGFFKIIRTVMHTWCWNPILIENRYKLVKWTESLFHLGDRCFAFSSGRNAIPWGRQLKNGWN